MLTSSQLCKFLMKFESSYDCCYTYQVSCPLYNYFIYKLWEANLPYSPEYDGEIPPGIGLGSLQPIFTKLAKSHISAQFFVIVYVLGWYTYVKTPQVLFSFCFRDKGSKLSEFMNDIDDVSLKNFLHFLYFLTNY